MLGRGDDDEVAKALDKLPAWRLSGLEGRMLRYRVHRAAGNDHLAEAVLAEAARTYPKNCKVLVAQRSVARGRDDVREEDRLTKALRHCSGSLELRARLAETRDRVDEAVALWKSVLERVPDDVDAIEALARLSAARGDFEDAAQQLERILKLNPQRVGVHIGLADLAAARGDGDRARAQLQAALEKIPHSHVLHRAAAQVGIPDDLDRWRVDGGDALRSYQALGKKYDGVAEVLVLDRSVSRVYENGGQRTLVHLVVHLLTKEALDRYGELSLPEEADLLTLYSIKSDGTIEEPERIPGKDGVSLRNLEVGDFVEYEFVVETQPSAPLPGYVDISAFRFQSLDVQYHRSELWVVHPEEMPVVVERRNGPPSEHGEATEIDGERVVVRKFRADEVPRLGVEPGHRALLDELPTVRVFTKLDVQTWLRNLGGNLRYAQRANPELRRLVRNLTRRSRDDRDKLQALWAWVVENIEDGGDLGTPATATLTSRAGNRLMLLRSMLREAGVPSELWLARDAYGPQPTDGGHPMVEGYDAAMLAVRRDGEPDPLMVLTASKVMPLGYLTPGYSGTTGVRVQLDTADPPPGPVKLLEAPRELTDRRQWKVSVEIDDQGGGKVSGRLELQGMEAVAWRQALRDIDRDRIEEVFQQAELGWLRGATLSSLKIENESKLTRPLVLEFAATAPEVGITQGGSLVLRSSPLPLNLGARYTGLPRRATGMGRGRRRSTPHRPPLHVDLAHGRRGGGALLRARRLHPKGGGGRAGAHPRRILNRGTTSGTWASGSADCRATSWGSSAWSSSPEWAACGASMSRALCIPEAPRRRHPYRSVVECTWCPRNTTRRRTHRRHRTRRAWLRCT